MTQNRPELRAAALAALLCTEPDAKCSAVLVLHESDCDIDLGWAPEPPETGIPGRPLKPRLVKPSQVPQRAVSTLEGRAALLHAIAHIEFNAIGLALDAIWRFSDMPPSYYRDWARVAAEEVKHFLLLRDRLRGLGFEYGDFDGHDGLWEMARKTAHDVLARMALVPRTLEARGLDASPQVKDKFLSVGDTESAAIIDVILHDEIGHVVIGNHWYRWLCTQRGIDPVAVYEYLVRAHAAPRLRGPFNVPARLAAGFSAEELTALGVDLSQVP